MKKLLIFQHVQRESPSTIAEYAEERGIGLDIVKLWSDDLIPDLAAYDGLIILGGPMGVYENYPRKEEELAVIAEHIGKVPMLGICLGAQILAHALGANVYPHSAKEIGYYDVSLTKEGKRSPLFVGFPDTFTVLQWHGDTFDMPKDATLLAEAPGCTHQAFSRGSTYGIQFHLEATPAIIAEWIREGAAWTHGFALDDTRVHREAEANARVLKEQCFRLMDNFLSQ